MPVSTNATFIAEKNKSSNQPIFLYTLFNYDGLGNNLTYAEYDVDIVYQSINDPSPVTYQAFPVTHASIDENTSGQVDVVQITASNVSRLIQAFLELYEFAGLRVSIKSVWANQLSDNQAFVEHVYYIDSWTSDQMNVVFSASSKFDVLVRQIPGRVYSRTMCAWAPRFKGLECKYVGPEKVCNGTLQQCRIFNNVINFGGQPATPSEKIFS